DETTSRLLAQISPVEGEEILTRHWAHLRYSPDFVQTALYLASPRTLALAAKAIHECPEPKKLFEFIDDWSAQNSERHGKPELSSRRLGGLAPYLHLFDKQAIGWLWLACNRQGLVS